MFELRAIRNSRSLISWYGVQCALLAVCLLAAFANYATAQSSMAPGLKFVSDGVTKATNPQREICGFERTHSISTESAPQIAKEAELFGQEDDIIVLTVARTEATA